MDYGIRLATATLLLYLAEGALGLPVFAGTPEKGLGLAYMAGPTGGYLVGYVLAAAACGWLAERGWDRNVLSATVAMLVGRSEEHTSELQSLMRNSYAVFFLKKKSMKDYT